MSFYMNVSDMLDDYGVDIKVWPAKKPHTSEEQLVGGFSLPSDKLSDLDPKDADERHDPVLPINSMTSELAQILAGGQQTNGDLLWLSSGKYNIGTIVWVPTQMGYYRVTNLSNYQDYSNLIIYELKGDDENQDATDTTTQGQATGDLHTSTGGEDTSWM